MRTNIEIAQTARCKPIEEVTSKIGLGRDEIQHYGKYMAKIPLDVLKRFDDRPNGKLIVTSAITPTPALATARVWVARHPEGGSS